MVNANKTSPNRGPLEINSINSHALVSFRAIVAGFLIVMFTFVGLSGLGLAIGAAGMGTDTPAQGGGLFTDLWPMITALLSLFVGSYFAARISKFRTGRVGSLQGLVIASLFIGFFMYLTFTSIGPLGSVLGTMLGKSGNGFNQLAQENVQNSSISYTLNNLTEDSLGDLNLKSGAQFVAQGLNSRLIGGDLESAKNYLALEAGITATEAEMRISEIKPQVDKYLAEGKEAALATLRTIGRTLFLLVALGALASIGGGSLGSVANFRRPLVGEASEDYVYS
jgi:hypothetical protein